MNGRGLGSGGGLRLVAGLRSWRWLLIVGAGLALLGHLWFWYLPRVREASPRPGDAPAALLGDERFSVRLWLPYPHQTLGEVTRSVGDAKRYLESLARLAGSSSPWLPSFGPFALPPAREMTVARGRGGEVVVAARIYPMMAVVGRLAGVVARNPGLAGGEARAAGRTVRVGWRGTLWTLESGAGGLGEAGPEPSRQEAHPPAIGALALGEGIAHLEEGTYLLSRSAAGGVLLRRLGAEPPAEATVPPLVSGGVALVLVEREGRAEDPAARGVRALLLSPPQHAEPGELPGAASVARPGARRFSLPGESLSSLLDLRLHRQRLEGLDVVALDRQSLDAAARLVPALARVEPDLADLELWLDPAGVAALTGHLARTLARVPVVGREEIRFWQDLERILSPLGRFRSVVLVSSGDAVEVRFEPGGRLTGSRR